MDPSCLLFGMRWVTQKSSYTTQDSHDFLQRPVLQSYQKTQTKSALCFLIVFTFALNATTPLHSPRINNNHRPVAISKLCVYFPPPDLRVQWETRSYRHGSKQPQEAPRSADIHHRRPVPTQSCCSKPCHGLMILFNKN